MGLWGVGEFLTAGCADLKKFDFTKRGKAWRGKIITNYGMGHEPRWVHGFFYFFVVGDLVGDIMGFELHLLR